MGRLRTAIELVPADDWLQRLPQLPEIPKLRSTRRKMEADFTEADAPPVEELKSISNRLAISTSHGQLSAASGRDWRQAGYCLWLKEAPLAQRPGFLGFYFLHLVELNKRTHYRSLIAAYFMDYDRSDKTSSLVGRFLATEVLKWDWIWAKRQRELSLFDMENGPSNVGRAVVASDRPTEEILEDVGLSGTLASGGFAKATFLSALKILRSSLASDNPDHVLLFRILDWAQESGNLRYAGVERELADALLAPWVNRTPQEAVQEKIKDFVLSIYKDPRIRTRSASRWMAVSDESKSVFLRWLVGLALEQFFQVVDRVAVTSQWEYRRAFWGAYFKAGVIDEAWVAFAYLGASEARRSFKNATGFGRLEGSGVSADHAVLIMRIGGLTIADWSHNGKCHIWQSSNRSAPKLYLNKYTDAKFQLSRNSNNKGVVHSHAVGGTWQRNVEKYIRDQTGIALQSSKYMP
jgi:EH signature protein